jgi:hypothetical protein
MALLPRVGNLRPSNPVLSRALAGYANGDRFLASKNNIPVLFDGTSVADGDETYITGTIQRIAAGAFFGDPSARAVLAAGETYPIDRGADYNPLTYACAKYGRLAEVLWEHKRGQQAGGVDAETLKQIHAAANVLLIDREVRLAALLMTPGNWNALNRLTGVAAAPGANQFLCWNVAGSNPNVDLLEACNRVNVWGQSPNTIYMGKAAALALQANSSFVNFDDVNLDRSIITPSRLNDVLASRFGLKNVYVGEAVRNTSTIPGTVTLARIWGDDVLVCYEPDGAPPALESVGDGGVPNFDVMTPMALGKIVAENWKVSPMISAGEDRDAEQYKLRYMEWVGVVQDGLGCQLANVVN